MNGDGGNIYKGAGQYVRKAPQPKQGSLQFFTDVVLDDGMARGRSYKMGQIDQLVVDDLEKNGITPFTTDVTLMDDTIIKYVNHTKRKKGAAIDFAKMNKVEEAINHPKHIYQDVKHGTLIYVFANDYEAKRYVKAIVHINFNYKGKSINKLKSIGIVDKDKMGMTDAQGRPIYRKIK